MINNIDLSLSQLEELTKEEVKKPTKSKDSLQQYTKNKIKNIYTFLESVD